MRFLNKRFWRYFFVTVTFAICFAVISCIAALIHGEKIVAQTVGRQIVISFAGVFASVVILFLCRIIYHRAKSHKSSPGACYHAFIKELEDALDKIAQGDFATRVKTKEELDMLYGWGHHMGDLADKINKMAIELGGMERMRQNFVSNVSHEIQSPLTSIHGFIALLKDDELSRQEQLHYLEIIDTESLRLSRLSENLLRLSTLESEFAAIHPEKYSLNRQIKDTILLLEPQWEAKQIEVSFSGEQITVFADKDLLSQVWINLLNNSIKFTPKGKQIALFVAQAGTEVTLTLADKGIGMNKEEITHIFERFYMADKARNRNMGGSGLGLSIVKKIVQMHGGHITVESNKGEGTIFKVVMPRNVGAV